jgi:hypothetical protein
VFLAGAYQNFYVNTRKVSYYNIYEKLYAGKNYSRTFAKSEKLLFDKDVVNFPCEEIATRLSGSLLLKYKNFKRPCPLTFRDASLSSSPSDFSTRALLKKMGGVGNYKPLNNFINHQITQD